LYGGRYNPIIVVDEIELANYLVELFAVDTLYAISSDKEIKEFIARYKHLSWPLIHDSFFIDGSNGKLPNFLDVYHSIRRIKEEVKELHSNPNLQPVVFNWSEDDPLKDIFLMTFGAYPPKHDIGIDYLEYVTSILNPKVVEIKKSESLDAESYTPLTINRISAFDLFPYGGRLPSNDGIYVGSVLDFEDLVNYWNLKAGHRRILFYDPHYSTRLESQRDHFLDALRKTLDSDKIWKDRITIWTKDGNNSIDVNDYGSEIIQDQLSIYSWNGLNINVPQMQFEDQSVLGAISDKGKNASITFQLPTKPFYSDPYFHTQYLAVAVSPLIDLREHEGTTVKPPRIPELNEYYGRHYYFDYDKVRSSRHGISIIINATRDDLTIRSLESRDLIKRIFGLYSIKAEPSQAGLIASRLIQQLGGLQGCRVLKITGVRDLIDKYNPFQSFSRSNAIQIIGQNDPMTGQPNFKEYESLYIEQRSHRNLKPEDAFKYLLSCDVFRIGLNFVCPDCQLEFWLSVDDTKKKIKCEFCGNEFDIASQLNDRDWAYRRSGLFGRDNNQEGSIAVSVTLQQLETVFSLSSMIYTTGLNLILEKEGINKCEVDFALLSQSFQQKPKLVIGECKTRKLIDANDIENLTKIADAIDGERFEVFIVIAKLSDFTEDEITLAKKAQSEFKRRVILLSARELEPYHIYERANKEFEVRSYGSSLEDLAEATQDIYFDPKPKKSI
jgi:hypothetical protein